MPLYDFRCSSGHSFTRFVKLADFDVMQLCECGAGAKRKISAPAVRVDLPTYVSPVTGKLVDGRRARRDDLARAGCVEYDPDRESDITRAREASEQSLERAVEETVESELSRMPARKRELLDSELRSGASVEVVRKSV